MDARVKPAHDGERLCKQPKAECLANWRVNAKRPPIYCAATIVPAGCQSIATWPG